jgi:catechol 2,3-dioxygenase-like lactoylglutathione lyase family enzyme
MYPSTDRILESSLYVADVTRSAQFYERVFGFRVAGPTTGFTGAGLPEHWLGGWVGGCRDRCGGSRCSLEPQLQLDAGGDRAGPGDDRGGSWHIQHVVCF